MALIEGIGDDVITLLFLLFLVVIVIMSWLSTNVRDLPRPTNFYFIERSTGRLFTANSLDGNLHVLSDPSRHQSSSSLRGSTLRASSDSPSRVGSQFRGAEGIGEDLTGSNSGGSDFTSSSSRTSSSNDSTEHSSSGSTGGARRSSNHELDIVDELVEQALVDNLLDGNITYTHRPPHLDESVVNAATTTMNSSNSDVSLQAATTSIANEIATGDSVNEELRRQQATANEDFIDIFVRFVNEREIKLRVKPNDTISFLKRTHFSQELSNNKIVRFIYQGQFLNEKATIRSYNIKDQTTIHCHITTKQLTAEATRNVTSAFNVDQQEPQTTTPIVLTTTTTTTTSSSSLISTSSTTTQSSTVNNPIETTEAATPMQQQQRQQLEPVIDMISLLLNHCILPLLAGLLTGCWYFRINFKHLFTPLTTLILVIFTFLYALFLFIYIHSTSAYVFNSFFMINRNHPHMATSLVQRRRNRPHHLHVHND